MKAFDEKINKKYGSTKEKLSVLKYNDIKNLQINQNNLKREKYKIIKTPFKIIFKGALLGSGLTGIINGTFPDIIPTLKNYMISISSDNVKEKILSYYDFNKDVLNFSKGQITIISGAILGTVLYTGFKIIKTSSNSIAILHDRKKAKKLSNNH